MKSRSLKQKLITRSMATMSAAIVTILAVFIIASVSNNAAQIDYMRGNERDNLLAKGRALVEDKSLTLRAHIEYQSIREIGKIVKSNGEGDKDIIFACYIDVYQDPKWKVLGWYDADDPDNERMPTGVYQNPVTEWAVGLNEPDSRELPGGEIEFAAPIFMDNPELELEDDPAIVETLAKELKAGAILYRLSTKSMNARIASEETAYRARFLNSLVLLLGLSLAIMGFAFVATQRQAATITQPLGILTSAADTIASGNYSIEVTVHSRDEIEGLASSFNKMAQDLGTSYRDLHLKNRQLEEARKELEDLNKHLEEKVEERTAQLRESESKFRTLFEESADAIALNDGDRFIDCNPAMLRMIGCRTKKEFLSLSPNRISPAKQPDGSDSVDRLDRVYTKAALGGSQHFEWVNQKVDGSEFATEIVVTSFPLNGKQVLHQVFRDITERRKIEETLRQTQLKLVETAHSAGMAEIATGVLHNIGNILNSVNISTEEIAMILKQSKVKGFVKANDMMRDNMDDLGGFFANHPKGKLIPGYYLSLGEAINDEHRLMHDEVDALAKKVAMMRDVISTQQNYAKASLYVEDVVIVDLVEDAVKLQIAALKKQGVKIKRNYVDRLTGTVPKVKLVHVLTNLIKNSKEAMSRNEEFNKPQELVIEVRQSDMNNAEITVSDNGCGIKPKNLDKIFNHGFTTKVNGHGFGLHTCANFMTEMGGALSAESEGDGKGSCFKVKFPLVCKDMRVHEEIEV